MPSINNPGKQSIGGSNKKSIASVSKRLITVVPTNADYWYLGYTQPNTTPLNYDQVNPHAEYVVKTDATTLNIQCGTSLSGSSFTTIGVFVNGVYNQSLFLTTTNVTKTITLAEGTKEVRLRLGVTNLTSGTQTKVLGQYIFNVSGICQTLKAVPPVRKNNVIIMWGDSIFCGFASSAPDNMSTVPLMRANPRMADYDIICYAIGGQSINNGLGVPSTYAQSLSEIKAILAQYPGNKVLASELAINDYVGQISTPMATLQSYLTNFLNDVRTAYPTTKLIFQTALPKTSEVANSQGRTVDDYRTLIANTQASFSNSQLLDGKALFQNNTGFVSSDLIHYTDQGYYNIHIAYTRMIAGLQQLPVATNTNYYANMSPDLNGFITFLNSNISRSNKTEWTIAMRVKRLRAVTTEYLFGQGSLGNGISLSFASDGRMGAAVNVFSVASASTSQKGQYLDQGWHKYVFTYKNGMLSLYQDGILFGVRAMPSPWVNSNGTTKVGVQFVNSNTPAYSNFAIDSMRILNVGLTGLQVEDYQIDDSVAFLPSVAGAWDFEQNISDLTGNGNTGTAGSTVTYSNV